MKKFFLPIVAAGAILTVSACTSDEPNGNERHDIEISRTENEIVGSQQTFAFNLINQKLKGINNSNVALSPFSAAMSLSITANGTDGAMQREILDALQFSTEEDLDAMNTLSAKLLAELPALDSKVKFIAQQSVWNSNSVGLQDNFASVCAKSYKCSFGSFSSQDEGASAINNWLGRNTNGMIRNALTKNDVGDINIINATYFKGEWSLRFREENTKQKSFTCADGSISQVPMMACEANRRYQEDDDMQIVSLPFGNRSYHMTIILPREGKTLESVLDGMDRRKWNTWKSMMVNCDVSLQLPRFTMENKYDLRDDLEALGINSLWYEDATRMTSPNVRMKQFIHNVKVIVNEEGAEAAAASSAVGGYISAGPGEQVEMNCNHPFAFVIEEQSTGAILFIGAVNRL